MHFTLLHRQYSKIKNDKKKNDKKKKSRLDFILSFFGNEEIGKQLDDLVFSI